MRCCRFFLICFIVIFHSTTLSVTHISVLVFDSVHYRCLILLHMCFKQTSPTWFSIRTRRSEPSKAAVSIRPLIWSHQKSRSSVKSMVRPVGDMRPVLAMITRLLPSRVALSTTGRAPVPVQNNFLQK